MNWVARQVRGLNDCDWLAQIEDKQRRLLVGDWKPTEPTPEFLIALEYCYLTERYDRMVCSGESRYGNAMPGSPMEQSLITKNALRDHQRARQKLERGGLSYKAYVKERGKLQHLTFKALEELYEHHAPEMRGAYE